MNDHKCDPKECAFLPCAVAGRCLGQDKWLFEPNETRTRIRQQLENNKGDPCQP